MLNRALPCHTVCVSNEPVMNGEIGGGDGSIGSLYMSKAVPCFWFPLNSRVWSHHLITRLMHLSKLGPCPLISITSSVSHHVKWIMLTQLGHNVMKRQISLLYCKRLKWLQRWSFYEERVCVRKSVCVVDKEIQKGKNSKKKTFFDKKGWLWIAVDDG